MKISGLFFAMVIVAFLLPFLVVKCGDTELAKLSGLKLATGGEVKSDFMDKMTEGLSSMKPLGDDTKKDDKKEEKSDNKRIDPNLYALVSLVLAIAGVALALVLDKKKYLVLVVVAALGFVSLLMIKSGFKGNLTGNGGPDMSSMIQVETQIGFFVALILFIAAAVTAFIFGRPKEQIRDDVFPGYYEKPAPISPVSPIPIDELEPEPPVLEDTAETEESIGDSAENKEGEV